MKGFIFAAGFGERLRPVTESIPKPLIPVLNIPSICYAIMLLKEAGINDIICNLHYKSQDIINFFNKNNNFGVNIIFSIEEEILGTGGGLKNCEEYFDDDFVIINSDIIIDIELNKVIKFHKKGSSPATVVLYETDRAGEIGPVGVANSRVADFKNYLNTGLESGLIYTGIAVLSPLIFNYLVKDFSSIVYTGYIEMIKKHALNFFTHKSIWLDIGTIESFWKANFRLLDSIGLFEERINLYLNKKLDIISERSTVGSDSKIINSIVGNDCKVGDKVIVENSVLLPHSKVSNNIRNSVVFGEEVFKI